MVQEQNKMPLFEALIQYREKNTIPFDVPGHKKGQGLPEFREYVGSTVLELDVNSMKPLDNISNPMGVIKEAEYLMAKAYGADEAFFLVNGTSSGVQSMIMSVCKPGDSIILPRNAHKSGINGLILSGAIPIYVEPEIHEHIGMSMGVTIEVIEKAIKENPHAKAVFIINPTYYGVVSNLKKIIHMAHSNNMAVLVDEAHGAHFTFHHELPSSAAKLGADLIAVSMHKTGGSLTQSSVLLLNEGIIDRNMVKSILNLTQTTSASYLLMSSLDVARKMLATRGEEILTSVLEMARQAREKINQIPGVYAFGKELVGTQGVYAFDETKLGIYVADLGYSGFEIYDMLRDDYNIQVEFGDTYNILAIISVGDRWEFLDLLIRAIEDIAIHRRKDKVFHLENIYLQSPEVVVSPRDAYYTLKELVLLEDAAGEISGESVMTYPPGIPIVAPGERINKQIIEYIRFLSQENSMLTDTEDPKVEYIKVLRKDKKDGR